VPPGVHVVGQPSAQKGNRAEALTERVLGTSANGAADAPSDVRLCGSE
jgi:hypothetical protein